MFRQQSDFMEYGLNTKPSLKVSLLVALQHLLAVFGGIITAPLIIAIGMGLSIEETSYFVSSSLVLSGVATFIQISRFGPVGSGLLSIQGTSFTFIGPLISAYFMLVEGFSGAEALGMIFGTSILCALTVLLLGQFIEKVQSVITPNVTGTIVMLIGISLIWSSLKNLFSEINQANGNFGDISIIVFLCSLTFITTLIVSQLKHAFARMLSITAGLCVGFIAAIWFGLLDFSKLNQLEIVFIPEIAHFPLSVNFSLYVILLPIFLISSLETIGDLTATSSLSGVVLNSKDYWQRLRGGITGDALNTALAALFCAFPNTSFSQNNGVIRLTGVCSRHVGRFVALYLMILGVFPLFGGMFILIPNSVLVGATLLMFIMVFVSGSAIIHSHSQDEKKWLIVATSIVLGWSIATIVNGNSHVPEWLSSILAFPISTGAIIAIFIEGSRKVLVLWNMQNATP